MPMGMAKIRPSHNPNPLPDYVKTLHNYRRALTIFQQGPGSKIKFYHVTL